MRELFTGWTNIIPLVISVVIIVFALWVSQFAYRVGWAVSKRIAWLSRLRGLIPILPLAGLFGTVVSLIVTLSFMGENAAQISQIMPEVIRKFAPALTSTMWGISGAFVSIIIIELGLHKLEDHE